jgi:hypothetical protein
MFGPSFFVALALHAAPAVPAVPAVPAPAGPEGFYVSDQGSVIITPAKAGYEFDFVGGNSRLKLHPAPSEPHIMTTDGEIWAEFTPEYSGLTLTATSPENQDPPLKFKRASKEEETAALAKGRQERVAEEAHAMLIAFMVAERSFYVERETYSADPKWLMLTFDPCRDGTHAKAKAGELAGCNFVMSLKTTGKGQALQVTATVTGASEAAKGLSASMATFDRPGTPAFKVLSSP